MSHKKSDPQADMHEWVETPMSRRNVLDVMAAGGLAMMMGSLPQASFAAPKDDVVRIGYLPITDAAALLIAHANGYFKEEGIKAAKPRRVKGWPSLVKGFAGGHFNLVHLLKPIPVWMRYNNNIPIKIMAWAHMNGSAIVVGKNTGVEDFADLGGRRLAIPFWYSMHNIVLQEGLRSVGLEAIPAGATPPGPKQCALEVMPPPLMVKAMNTGKIDGFTVAEPFNALGELKAGGKIMRFTGDIWRNHPCCVVCMHEERLTEKAEWTQKVMNAVVRAEIFASNNKAETARILSKDGEGYLPMPAKVVERGMTFYDSAHYAKPHAIRNQAEWGNGRIDFSPYPYPSATRRIVENMNQTVVEGDNSFLNKVTPDHVAEDLVNYDFVRNALDKYPEWKKLPGVNPDNPFEREEIVRL